MAKIKFWCIMAMLSIMVIDLTGHCITVRRDLLHKREEKEERYRAVGALCRSADRRVCFCTG